jgi:hypothetical protein
VCSRSSIDSGGPQWEQAVSCASAIGAPRCEQLTFWTLRRSAAIRWA